MLTVGHTDVINSSLWQNGSEELPALSQQERCHIELDKDWVLFTNINFYNTH